MCSALPAEVCWLTDSVTGCWSVCAVCENVCVREVVDMLSPSPLPTCLLAYLPLSSPLSLLSSLFFLPLLYPPSSPPEN